MGGIGCRGLLRVLVMFLAMSGGSVSVLAAPATKVEAADKVAEPAKPPQATTPEAPVVAQVEPIFAKVNGTPITVREYRGLLAETMRGRFYHGAIPAGKEEELYKEVADLLIDRELLVVEAGKRGILPDPAKFEKTLADLDARYAARPDWKEKRDQLLPQIKANSDRQSMLEQIEKAVHNVPQPSRAEVRAYYDQHPDLFTEPEKLNLSVILLKVDPGATQEIWKLAHDEAQKIFGRIRDGADFAQQARLHSQHDSAANGGNMGYLHGGVLPEGLENKLIEYKVGVVNEPMTTLEGVMLSRVEDRIPAKSHEFATVETRAQNLLIRDRAEEAWKKTITQLRADAKIEILTPQAPGNK